MTNQVMDIKNLVRIDPTKANSNEYHLGAPTVLRNRVSEGDF